MEGVDTNRYINNKYITVRANNDCTSNNYTVTLNYAHMHNCN